MTRFRALTFRIGGLSHRGAADSRRRATGAGRCRIRVQLPLALGPEPTGSELQRAPAGRPLTFTLEVTGLPVLPEYDVEAVDAKGAVQAQFHAVTAQSGIKIQLAEGLRRGNYFVRIYSPTRELLREYGVQVD